MDNNKIKLRNLDEEVINFFRANKEKLDFDDLNQKVLDVLNNTNAVNTYDDSGLRSDIAELKSKKIDTIEADSKYALKAETYTKTEEDEYRAEIDNYLVLELDKKLSVEEAKATYAKSAPGSITELMLSTDLQNKVNSRYENNRPETGDDSGVSISDFNLLKVSVNTNTINIDKILGSYINKNTPISKSLLDTSTQIILENARLATDKITLSDLDSELNAKINSIGSSGGENIQDSIIDFENIEKGDTLLASSRIDGTFALDAKKIFAREVLLISLSQDLEKAKDYCLTDGKYKYIGDIGSVSGDLYYCTDENVWEQDTSRTVYDLIAGRFAYDYSTQNMCFGNSPTACVDFIRLSEYLSNGDFEYEFTEFDDRLVELEVDFNDLATDYTSKKEENTAKFEEIDAAISGLTTNLETAKTEINNTISGIQTTVSTHDTDITNLKNEVETLKTEIETLKAEIEALKNP